MATRALLPVTRVLEFYQPEQCDNWNRLYSVDCGLHKDLWTSTSKKNVSLPYRGEIILWLAKKCEEMAFLPEVFFVAAHLLDTYISHVRVEESLLHGDRSALRRQGVDSDEQEDILIGFLAVIALKFAAELRQYAFPSCDSSNHRQVIPEPLEFLESSDIKCLKPSDFNIATAHMLDATQGISLGGQTPVDLALLYLAVLAVDPEDGGVISLDEQNELIPILYGVCLFGFIMVASGAYFLLPSCLWVGAFIAKSLNQTNSTSILSFISSQWNFPGGHPFLAKIIKVIEPLHLRVTSHSDWIVTTKNGNTSTPTTVWSVISDPVSFSKAEISRHLRSVWKWVTVTANGDSRLRDYWTVDEESWRLFMKELAAVISDPPQILPN